MNQLYSTRQKITKMVGQSISSVYCGSKCHIHLEHVLVQLFGCCSFHYNNNNKNKIINIIIVMHLLSATIK